MISVTPFLLDSYHSIFREFLQINHEPYINANIMYVQCESKKSPPEIFWHFFPNGWQFFVQILHACYMFQSTLEYKFLFN